MYLTYYIVINKSLDEIHDAECIHNMPWDATSGLTKRVERQEDECIQRQAVINSLEDRIQFAMSDNKTASIDEPW